MANFTGTLDEFYQYFGPRSSDIVTQLARKERKNKYGNRISCGEDDNGSKCKQYTGLHAAHIKGRERKVIFQEILNEIGKQVNDDIFSIDIDKFEKVFNQKHENFLSVIKFMCPKHHKRYDLNNVNHDDLPYIVLLDEEEVEELIEIKEIIDDENITTSDIFDLITKGNINVIKEKLALQYHINKNQISCSNVSKANGLWNFDVLETKFDTDFLFVLINQNSKDFKVAFIKGKSLDLSNFYRKGEDKVRFIINSQFIDQKGFNFQPLIEYGTIS